MNAGQILQKRYRIDRILGKGSMGTTYKAYDTATRQPVAVKALHFSRVQECKVLYQNHPVVNTLPVAFCEYQEGMGIVKLLCQCDCVVRVSSYPAELH